MRAVVERHAEKLGEALLDPVALGGRLGHCTSLAIRRRQASAGFSIIRVLPILMDLSLPSWISFVSVGCEMPTCIQRPKSPRSSRR